MAGEPARRGLGGLREQYCKVADHIALAADCAELELDSAALDSEFPSPRKEALRDALAELRTTQKLFEKRDACVKAVIAAEKYAAAAVVDWMLGELRGLDATM